MDMTDTSFDSITSRIFHIEDEIGLQALISGQDLKDSSVESIISLRHSKHASPSSRYRKGINDWSKANKRSILSLIRGLDQALKKLQSRRELTNLSKIIKLLDHLEYFFETPDGAQSVLTEIKLKSEAVAQNESSMEELMQYFSEFKGLKSVVKPDCTINHIEFDLALDKAEALMAAQMEVALQVQKGVEDLMACYNNMIDFMTKKMLHLDARATRALSRRLLLVD
ncbi:hypothetical protein AAMO2058_000299800 [Amorphochlora amoebiformis]